MGHPTEDEPKHKMFRNLLLSNNHLDTDDFQRFCQDVRHLSCMEMNIPVNQVKYVNK
jgi:hypothetical protein